MQGTPAGNIKNLVSQIIAMAFRYGRLHGGSRWHVKLGLGEEFYIENPAFDIPEVV